MHDTTNDRIGSIDLTNGEADLLVEAGYHYLNTVLADLIENAEDGQREGYTEDSDRLRLLLTRVEMLDPLD